MTNGRCDTPATCPNGHANRHACSLPHPLQGLFLLTPTMKSTDDDDGDDEADDDDDSDDNDDDEHG